MSSARWMIPMLDFVFLSLGGLVALLTQTEFIKTLPLRLAEASGAEAAAVDEAFDVVSITAEAVAVNGEVVPLAAVGALLSHETVVVRCDAVVGVERLIAVLGVLREAGADRDVRLQVEGAAAGSFAAAAAIAGGGG